jgi:tetratricopeptide (TPR) repeat protein
MKRAAVILAIRRLAILGLAIFGTAVWAGAQTSGQPAPQSQPAAGTPATTPAPAQGAPAGKRPPQAKTQPEFDAYKSAMGSADAAAMEKAADDFAAKFPDSELRVLIYKGAMRLYQNSNNAEKAEAMGRKVIAIDPDDPEALVTVAEVIAERTHETDMDKDQRYAESIAMAQKSIQTLDTDLSVPAGTPQDKIDSYKAGRRSQAYSIIGTIDFKKEEYAAARENLQKSIDAYPADPDPVVVVRLALTIDKQATAIKDQDKAASDKLYAEALKVAEQAVALTKENTPVGTPARHELDRLKNLTGAAAPAQPQTPPKN